MPFAKETGSALDGEREFVKFDYEPSSIGSFGDYTESAMTRLKIVCRNRRVFFEQRDRIVAHLRQVHSGEMGDSC